MGNRVLVLKGSTKNCGTRELGLLALLLVLVATASPAFSQTQKPRPSANRAKAKVVKQLRSQPLSKEFRKSALLAKVAWDQVLDSIVRQDPKDTIRRYEDEAHKADAAVEADEQTDGDSGAHICLVRYETSINHAHITTLQSAFGRLNASAGVSNVADNSQNELLAFRAADAAGRIVDAILSDRSYANQCT